MCILSRVCWFCPKLTHKCSKQFLGWHFSIYSEVTFCSLIPEAPLLLFLFHHFPAPLLSGNNPLCPPAQSLTLFILYNPYSNTQGCKKTQTFYTLTSIFTLIKLPQPHCCRRGCCLWIYVLEKKGGWWDRIVPVSGHSPYPGALALEECVWGSIRITCITSVTVS